MSRDSFSRITPAMLPLLRCSVCEYDQSMFGSKGTRVILDMKYVNSWAFDAFLASKDTLNSNNSMAHFVKHLPRFSQWSTYFRGRFVRIVQECVRKYLMSFLDNVTDVKVIFSIFCYRVSSSIKDFNMKYTRIWLEFYFPIKMSLNSNAFLHSSVYSNFTSFLNNL